MILIDYLKDVFHKYGPKPDNNPEFKYKLDLQMFADVSIKKGRLAHIYNDHTVNRLIPQLNHLSREGLEKVLRKNSYFPPDWSEEIVRQAVEEAYKGALKHNVQDYTITYLGEKVTVRLNGENLKTAFGSYKYTVDEFLELFGG